MIKNPVKTRWAQGLPVLQGWLSVGNPFTAEIMAAQGYDTLCIDLQHGALGYSEFLPMMQAARASGVGLGARVPWNDPAEIMRVLDAGVLTVICPMISTAAQAEGFVHALRYPPRGGRSFGPTRATYALDGVTPAEANSEMVGFAMIETAEAMDNLEAIAAVDGLDGLYIGPADLSLALGQGAYAPGFDREEPEMVTAIQRILAVAKANGKRAGLHCATPEYAAKAVSWGFDLVTVSADARLLSAAAAQSVGRFRELTEE